MMHLLHNAAVRQWRRSNELDALARPHSLISARWTKATMSGMGNAKRRVSFMIGPINICNGNGARHSMHVTRFLRKISTRQSRAGCKRGCYIV